MVAVFPQLLHHQLACGAADVAVRLDVEIVLPEKLLHRAASKGSHVEAAASDDVYSFRKGARFVPDGKDKDELSVLLSGGNGAFDP